jgi:hypothetical protein
MDSSLRLAAASSLCPLLEAILSPLSLFDLDRPGVFLLNVLHYNVLTRFPWNYPGAGVRGRHFLMLSSAEKPALGMISPWTPLG